MIDKLFIANQFLMLLMASGLIIILLQADNTGRLHELELRQTNQLTYLESRVSNLEMELDVTESELRHNLRAIDARCR